MDLLELIKQMEEEKKQNSIAPSHALFIPLERRALELGMSNDQITDQLSYLYTQNKIRYERTINDKAIIRI